MMSSKINYTFIIDYNLKLGFIIFELKRNFLLKNIVEFTFTETHQNINHYTFISFLIKIN